MNLNEPKLSKTIFAVKVNTDTAAEQYRASSKFNWNIFVTGSGMSEKKYPIIVNNG